MADINSSSSSELSSTFNCALTSQYIMTFHRIVPPSVTIALCTFNILFAILASILNLLVMASIISTPKLQTPTFILLCNLALTDFTIGFVICSIEVVYLITRAVGQYGAFCTTWKVLVVLSYILCPASLYTITSISYDRYLSLQMKVKYKTVVTKRKACVTVVILWVWAGLGVTLMSILGKTPFLILVCCVTFFCLGVIIDCYLLCGAAIQQHQKEILSSTSVKKLKPKQESKALKESFRVNKGRKGIKRPIESFGQEIEERKRLAKSRDSGAIDDIGQFETHDFCQDDDSVGQRDSMEYEQDEEMDSNNERFDDLDLENDDDKALESEDEDLQRPFSSQNPKDDSGKRRLTTPHVRQVRQEKFCGGTNRHTLDPSILKYILVQKDMGSVIEEVEIEGKCVLKTELGDNENEEEKEEYEMIERKKRALKRDNSIKQAETSRLTIKKAQLLADIKKFKQTLHTILMIVAFLFICYLPYMAVSTLVTLRIMDIGVAWDLAAITVYVNSSISPIIMCTRISSIRQACRRILRRVCWCK